MKYEPENLYYKYLGKNFALYIYTCARRSHLLRPERWGDVIDVKVNNSVSAQARHGTPSCRLYNGYEFFLEIGDKGIEAWC
jgi:hypothetical protein